LAPLKLAVGALELGDDRVDAVAYAAVVIALLEARRHPVANDAAGCDIGQRAFEPVADFDAHFPVVRHDDDQHAVVLALLSELPGIEHAGCVLLDRLAGYRRYRQHRDLVGAGVFVCL
jgi:hypothetical protein